MKKSLCLSMRKIIPINQTLMHIYPSTQLSIVFDTRS